MIAFEDGAVLYEDVPVGIRIVARSEFSEAFLAQLEATTFGTSGLKYRRLDVRGQLERLPPGAFLELEVKDALVGTYALAGSHLLGVPTETAGLYRGLLSVRPEARGTGLGRLLVARTFDWIGSLSSSLGRPVYSWGCIERANKRSLRLLESMGARQAGSLETLTAYVHWPRKRTAIEALDDSAHAAIQAALSTATADCGLRTAAPGSGPYFAATSGERIDAGARVSLTRVDMATTGSAWDLAHRYLLRFVPPARRRFDPHNFTYLRLSDVVIREGCERLFKDFLSTLLARHDTYMAMFVLDPHSRTRALLEQAGLFGRFTASTRQEILVLANTWNVPADVLRKASRKPIGIGPLDT